jgi:hypothetical protein
MLRYKHIFILPILITALAVLILYGFFYQNILDVSAIANNFISTRKLIIPNGFNLKYLILFSGLTLMAFTDMLFERISAVIPAFLILAGLIFAYTSNTPLITVLEAYSF